SKVASGVGGASAAGRFRFKQNRRRLVLKTLIGAPPHSIDRANPLLMGKGSIQRRKGDPKVFQKQHVRAAVSGRSRRSRDNQERESGRDWDSRSSGYRSIAKAGRRDHSP